MSIPAGSQAWIFLACWIAGVIMPLLPGAMLSVLRRHGFHVERAFSPLGYPDLVDSGRIGVVLHTAPVAAVASLLCLVSGFPIALWLAR